MSTSISQEIMDKVAPWLTDQVDADTRKEVQRQIDEDPNDENIYAS